jgi:hypothetical protein
MASTCARKLGLLPGFGLALLILGCEPSEPREFPAAVARDSAGIRIVDHAGIPGNLPSWSISSDPIVEIGSLEGPGPDVVVACNRSSGHTADAAGPKPTLVGSLLIQNGTLALLGQDTAVTAIVIVNVGGGWRIREFASEPSVTTSDTVDASGLFIHSASAYERAFPMKEGSPAILVARTGPSVGDQAVALIGNSAGEPWQPVSLEENRPLGPQDPAVGCYSVDPGPWDNPTYAGSHPPELVPGDIRLHWQFAWHLGRERALVATDGTGHIPGPRTVVYYWRRTAADSVRITFGTRTHFAYFYVAAAGADLDGEVTRFGHNLPTPTATASVRLRRYAC